MLGFLGAAVAITLLIVRCVARLVEVVVVPHIDIRTKEERESKYRGLAAMRGETPL